MNKKGIVAAFLAGFVGLSFAAPAEVKIGIPTYLLAVAKLGAGDGNVLSVPAGIECGSTCAAMFSGGSTVPLTAMPAYGSIFVGWSGTCASLEPMSCEARCGSAATCPVVISSDRMYVNATFHIADSDGDGIPNTVEAAEGRNPLLQDNDVFGNARLFAMQQYRDFLSREADPPSLQVWTGIVANGILTRTQAIDAFRSSPEFSGFVEPVARLYFALYLRVPDCAGMMYNAGLLRNGKVTLAQLADFFIDSPEMGATYGRNLSPFQFVTLLYNNVLGRAPDDAGLAAWVNLIQSGYTRGQVLLGFVDSVEYQGKITNEVFVTLLYAGMLRRTPDPAGFSGWISLLDAGAYTREQVINGFFLSTEYHGRFLP